MSQAPPPRRASLLDVPPPTAADYAGSAAAWALKTTLALTALFAAWAVLQSLIRPDTFGGWPDLALDLGLFAVTTYAALFLGRLVWEPRKLRDRAFGYVGFLATFFGLFMLLVFFGRLAQDTVRWFQTVPALVRAENAELERRRGAVRDPEAFVAARVREVEAERADALRLARTPAERAELERFYEDAVLPQKRQDFEQMVRDWEVEIRESDRPPPTALGSLWYFLTHGSSSEDRPQDAGVYPALMGSLWIAFITMLFSVPVGVGAALYLEEYRGNSWFDRVIQVNINNLAGVPSVVYGVLGAFLFIDLVFRPLAEAVPGAGISPRNVLGGGMTLGLLTLPVIIVASQEAIRAVPRSIRQGAYALGATRWQVIWQLVLPMARPGILTGTILAISRAIGEAAPLVLFGIPTFVSEEPGLFSIFTVLPLQIYGWTPRVDEAWRYNAALTCVILMVLLLALNAVAIYFRNRGQRRML